MKIYSLSRTSWHELGRRVDVHVSSGRVNDYYEAVFRDMTVDGAFNARAVSFDDGRWYEVDTLEDLSAAEKLFADSRFAKRKIQNSWARPAISRDAA